MVKPGDMVLCRVNAPLIGECFNFIKRGVRAQIQGRDIGAGLISMIDRMAPTSIEDLVMKIDTWYHTEIEKENSKQFPSEVRIISLQDKKECLECFCDNANSVHDVREKIETIFTDNRNELSVLFSSGHKSKGLEADNVFILQLKGASCPHPMAKTPSAREQEFNLLYVMKTRAISHLCIVTS